MPARLVEGGAVAWLKPYSRTDTHPDRVVIVVIVVVAMDGVPIAASHDADPVETGAGYRRAGMENGDMGRP